MLQTESIKNHFGVDAFKYILLSLSIYLQKLQKYLLKNAQNLLLETSSEVCET